MRDMNTPRDGSDSGPYRASIDDPDHLVASVVRAVAATLGKSPFELEPIAHDVDPVPLERLVQDESLSGYLHFETNGVEVGVTDDGYVLVDPDC